MVGLSLTTLSKSSFTGWEEGGEAWLGLASDSEAITESRATYSQNITKSVNSIEIVKAKQKV